MTLVNAETGEILDVEAAERRASFICTDLDHAADTFETAMNRMREAIRERDDLVLGYRSPGDYLSDRFGGRLARLGVDLRREVVRELTEAGLSTRAIAPIVDMSKSAVDRDRQVSRDGTPHQTPEPVTAGEGETGSGQTPGVEESASAVPESPVAASSPPRPPVTGIDGKTYTPPAPKPRPVASVPSRVDEFTDQDRAEEVANSLARHLSALYAVTNPARRAEFINTWHPGIADRPVLGQQFVTAKHMRELASALTTFATEWEQANA